MVEGNAAAFSEDRFWSIVDISAQQAGGDQRAQEEALKKELLTLSEEDLIGFDRTYRAMIDRAYHWDLWAAAYIINGGCSDDGFDYFRDWLISLGRSAYEDALRDPETLADIAEMEQG